jgi:hypothetical protein
MTSDNTIFCKVVDFTDTYLQNLKWDSEASEYMKIIVSGNIRAFSGDLTNHVARVVLEEVEKRMRVAGDPKACMLLDRITLEELKKQLLG